MFKGSDSHIKGFARGFKVPKEVKGKVVLGFRGDAVKVVSFYN